MIDALRWLAETEATDGPFAAPGFLWWLLVVPLLALILALTARRHRARLGRLFSGEIADKVLPRSVRRRRTARDLLLLVALATGILALAGPRFDKRVQLVEARGVDLVLVVDLSRSMDAADVEPSRLERARREIFDLIELLEGDRVGLVVFAGGAYPRMPLTEDHEALRMIVTEMSTRDFQAQGSALHEAIRVAGELLVRDEASKAGRAMLILSDGEIHEPTLALEQAAKVREAGVRVFTMRVGDAPAPIPLGNGAWQEDRQGRRVISTPSDDLLRELAQVGGGVFSGSVPSAQDMQALYRTGVRGLLEAGVRGVRPKIKWRKAWMWPLSVAVLCGLLGAWLGEGRRRWGLAAAALLAVHLLAAPAAHAGTVAEADQAYRSGRYEQAVRILTELSYERPGDSGIFERLGAARYRAGDVEGAIRAWERQAAIEGRRRQETLFNLGNAHARSGRYTQAMERYDEALSLGDYPPAAQNRQIVEQEMQRRLAEQPPPPPDSGQDEQDDSGESDESESQAGAPGDPGQGEQGEPGEQPPGESEEKEEGEPGEGEPDEAEDTKGSGEGEPDEGDRSQSGDQATQRDGGQKKAGDDQERVDESDVDQVRPGELDQDPSETEAGGEAVAGQGEPADPEAQAAAQAERLLDGVQEGRPRITIPGGSGDKPW